MQASLIKSSIMSSKTKKVLLTGVTGYLGSHTAIQLLENGYEVVGTLRNASRINQIQKTIAKYTSQIDHLSFVVADLTDDISVWKSVMKGIDFVLHIASPIPRTLPKHPNDLIIPARTGILNILKAASQTGVKRVIMTSSTGAIDHGVIKRKVFTEKDWSDETNIKDNTPYFRSKTIAEKAAWQFMQTDQSELEFTVINPGLILGPILEQDYGTSPELIKKMLDGSMPALPKMGFALVDVRSAAALHIRAMEHPQATGQRFIAANDFFWAKDIAKVLKDKYPDKKIPNISLPNFAVRLFALIDKETRPVLSELGAERRHDSSKARKILHWQPISIQQSIIDTAESLIDFKLV